MWSITLFYLDKRNVRNHTIINSQLFDSTDMVGPNNLFFIIIIFLTMNDPMLLDCAILTN